MATARCALPLRLGAGRRARDPRDRARAALPELQPGRFLEGTGIPGDAGQRLNELRDAVRFAQVHAEELEQFLWDVLDAAVARSESTRAAAVARLAVANGNFASAPWYLRPVFWCQVVACRGVLAGANAGLTVVRTAREQGENAVELAKTFVEARRAELMAALREIARVGRLAASIAQLRGWATDSLRRCRAPLDERGRGRGQAQGARRGRGRTSAWRPRASYSSSSPCAGSPRPRTFPATSR